MKGSDDNGRVLSADFPRVEFSEHRLDNGLVVLLHPDKRAPLIHLTIHYRVGSSYEEPGYSGFAHLFEHLMFQGSENLEKNEHGRLVDEAGGQWNATTNKDRTNYYETLPSNCLDLGLWLEADRMRALRITEESFENQRQTVLEERKQSYENRPYGSAFLRFDALAYRNWAYGHSVIGDVEDLRVARLEDAVAFHDRHYGPDNAILALSGDFVPAEALNRITRYFEPIPPRGVPAAPDLSEPPQTQERMETVQDSLAVLPAVYMGYHMSEGGSADHYALAVAANALAQGASSRLPKLLTYEKNWVTTVTAGPNNYRGPELFGITFVTRRGMDVDKVVRVILDQVDRLCGEEITTEEIDKARHQFSFRLASLRRKQATIAESLARFAVYHGRAEAMNEELGRFLAITPKQVLDAAQRTFCPDNRTILKVEPKA